MSRTSYADYIRHWGELLVAVEANATELDHLEDQRTELEIHLDRLKEANTRQAALKARLQQATRDVEEHLDVGLLGRSAELRHDVVMFSSMYAWERSFA